MKIIYKILLTIIIGVFALSFWPGLIESMMLLIIMLGVFLVAPGIIISLIIILTLQWRRSRSLDFSELKVYKLVFVTLGVGFLVIFELPSRATLFLNKESIIEACNSNNDVYRAGVFNVQSSAISENGIYLVVLQHGDGLGPDIVSHGIFCGEPSKITPYGSARGEYFWVTSNIYYFFVSDDF